jgi:hypothetical protein
VSAIGLSRGMEYDFLEGKARLVQL